MALMISRSTALYWDLIHLLEHKQVYFESEKVVEEIMIHAIDGKSILTKFVDPSNTIDISDLMDGTYLIEFVLENGTRIIRKMSIFH